MNLFYNKGVMNGVIDNTNYIQASGFSRPRCLRDVEIKWVAVAVIVAGLDLFAIFGNIDSLDMVNASVLSGVSALGVGGIVVALQKLYFASRDPVKKYRVEQERYISWSALEDLDLLQRVITSMEHENSFKAWKCNCFKGADRDVVAHFNEELKSGMCHGASAILMSNAEEFRNLESSQIYKTLALDHLESVVKAQIYSNLRRDLAQYKKEQSPSETLSQLWTEAKVIKEEYKIVQKKGNKYSRADEIPKFQRMYKRAGILQKEHKRLAQIIGSQVHHRIAYDQIHSEDGKKRVNSARITLATLKDQFSEVGARDAVIQFFPQEENKSGHAIYVQAREGSYWFSDTYSEDCGIYTFDTKDSLFKHLQKHLVAYKHREFGSLDPERIFIEYHQLEAS